MTVYYIQSGDEREKNEGKIKRRGGGGRGEGVWDLDYVKL